MSIAYTYKVTKVHRDSGTMEVVYSAAGYADKLVSMLIPLQGNSVDATIRSHAPINFWVAEITPRIDVQVGYSGSHNPNTGFIVGRQTF